MCLCASAIVSDAFKLVTDLDVLAFTVWLYMLYTGAVSKGSNAGPNIRAPEILIITPSRVSRCLLQSLGEVQWLSQGLPPAGPARDENEPRSP